MSAKGRKLRILRVTSALYPEVIGGHAIQCHEISMHQTKQGHKVTVLTVRRNKLKPTFEIVEGGYSVIRLNRVWMPWDSMLMPNPVLPGLSQTIQELDFDLVHVHSHLFWASVAATKKAISLKKPVITTVHGVLAKRSFLVNSAQLSYLCTFGSWVLKNSTRIICLTKSDASEITRFGADSAKIRVIPNAVNIKLFKPTKLMGEYVLWVGRYVPEKGLQYLIEAAREILATNSKVKFFLVGDGPLKPHIVKYVREKGLTKNFSFVSGKRQKEVAEITQNASIFVLSSVKEGFPKALLEAMACGKPVVVPDIDGINEIVKNGINGLLFPAKQSKSMAEDIVKLINDKELRERLGKKAFLTAQKNHNWTVVANAIEKVYNETLN